MPVRRRRPTAVAAAVATAAALGATALTGATSAAAAEVPLSGYELTWGIKESYRTYVATFAKGTFAPAGGATQADGNGAFTFVNGIGSYDSTAHTVDLGFEGALAIESTAHGFALTLSDVRFDSAAAEITADVTRGGETEDDVPLATVTVTRAMTDMATRLTEEAGEVFGSASYAGAAGDPLTVVQKTEPTPTDPEPTDPEPTDPEPTEPEPTADPTDEPTSPEETDEPTDEPSSPSQYPSPSASTTSDAPTPAPAKGGIADGTLGWGVKESFRTYVVGPVAKGRVTASDGASQASGNGAFTFADASGAYDTDEGTLNASFEGAVNFKGHEESGGAYGLDLTLTDLKATLDGGTGRLSADVDSLGEESQDVVLATLKAKSPGLTAKDDVITVNDVAATLTEAGAEAFGDFYTAGTALDPVDLSVAVSDDADLPGGTGGSGTGGAGTTGGTSGTTGGTGTTGSTTGSTTGGLNGALASTGSNTPVAAIGGAAAAAVAAGAAAVFVMRRRRSTME
ncbi:MULTISPECIES: HtaA domain-containing protein [unclassified Streptomyces]|uniref:HtaA domain-containing protein n=1 Tax=unclassified Streptomyces TaxID=2593676 RepID=UPI00073B97FF|nr:HtaA domain-containing protein [Streptomyces sp. AVP053U2]ODA69869.1 Htaa [Streptomyces sp. AVP053U2]